MTASPIDQLALTLNLTGGLIAGVGPDQWAGPTPCAEWTVADLVAHMVTGNYVFARILHGTPLAEAGAVATAATAPGGDLAEGFRDAASKLMDAYGQPGVLEQMFTIPVGTMPGVGTLHIRMVEMLVHGWDLAQATGQATAFPDDLVEQELAFTGSQLAALPAGRSPFGPGQPAAHDAPAIIRLAACLGRPVPA
jgi:uncharacterized protein (TIGR03086 family)